MENQQNSSRAVCYQCMRAQSVCLCSKLSVIQNPYPIFILRHQSERRHALNTVKILERMLSQCNVMDGEGFDDRIEFQQTIQNHQDNLYLLYPDENAISLEEIPLDQDVKPSFLLLDGTLNKTKRVQKFTHSLKNLKTVILPDGLLSEYRLRHYPEKGPTGMVSSLEAVYYLLSQLEGNQQKYLPLMEAFRYMIDQQIEKMGWETYQKYYLKN